MKNTLMTIIILSLLMIGCNSQSSNNDSKEKELLEKEIELLKKHFGFYVGLVNGYIEPKDSVHQDFIKKIKNWKTSVPKNIHEEIYINYIKYNSNKNLQISIISVVGMSLILNISSNEENSISGQLIISFFLLKNLLRYLHFVIIFLSNCPKYSIISNKWFVVRQWCLDFLGSNNKLPVSNSTIIQPNDHISIFSLYL